MDCEVPSRSDLLRQPLTPFHCLQNGFTVLHSAVEFGRAGAVKALLEVQPPANISATINAAQNVSCGFGHQET